MRRQHLFPDVTGGLHLPERSKAMNRVFYEGRPVPELPSWEDDRRQAQQQSSDISTLQRAKELLCDLWKQGRVTIEVRFAAENALSAALYAVEAPAQRDITLAEGAYYSGEQWKREQEAKNREF